MDHLHPNPRPYTRLAHGRSYPNATTLTQDQDPFGRLCIPELIDQHGDNEFPMGHINVWGRSDAYTDTQITTPLSMVRHERHQQGQLALQPLGPMSGRSHALKQNAKPNPHHRTTTERGNAHIWECSRTISLKTSHRVLKRTTTHSPQRPDTHTVAVHGKCNRGALRRSHRDETQHRCRRRDKTSGGHAEYDVGCA